MDARLVFVKTAKGEEELALRTFKLNHALRYVLILVDGKSTVKEILDKGAGLPNMEQALNYLATGDFVVTLQQVKNTSRVQHSPRSEIIELAQSMFGDKAAPIVKKLRETSDATDALVQTTNACKRLIKLTIDDKKAEDFVRRSQEIIYASTLHTESHAVPHNA